MTGAPDGWLTKFPKRQLLILGTALLSSLVLGFSASEAHGAEAPTADTTDPTHPAHPAHPQDGVTTPEVYPAPDPSTDGAWHKPDFNTLSPDGKHEGMVDNDTLNPDDVPGSGQTFAYEYKGRWVQDVPGGHWRWEIQKKGWNHILP